MALILMGCKESLEVTTAFRELGHEAYSCDLKAALKVAENEVFETYCWNECNCSPVDLLYSFEGYDYYMVISKKEYDKFNAI